MTSAIAIEWAMSSPKGRIMHLIEHGKYRPLCGVSGYMLKRVLDLTGEALDRTERVPFCPECRKIWEKEFDD